MGPMELTSPIGLKSAPPRALAARSVTRYLEPALFPPTSLMRRLLKWLLILVVVFGGLAAAGHFGQQYLKAKSVPRFTTVAVSTGKIETVVNSSGPIKPVQSVSVGSFVSGPIAQIKVDFNDKVTKGQELALIDPRL